MFELDAGWTIKLVLSSYTFTNNGAQGYPDGLSDCKNCKGTKCSGCSKSMPKATAYDPSSTGYDCYKNGQWQEGAFTRVHRDQATINAMRNWMRLPKISNMSELGVIPKN